MEVLTQLKTLVAAGHMTPEEYDQRRIQIIDQLTGTSAPPASPFSGAATTSSTTSSMSSASYGSGHVVPPPVVVPSHVAVASGARDGGHFANAWGTGATPEVRVSGAVVSEYTSVHKSGVRGPIRVSELRAPREEDELLPSSQLNYRYIKSKPPGQSSGPRVEQLPTAMSGLSLSAPTPTQTHQQQQPSMVGGIGGASLARSQGQPVFSWELFHAAGMNNVKRLQEILASGVDVNQCDTDTGNNALHHAAQKGQRHALFFLVECGTDVNHQNKRGQTPLHLLINNRYTNLAVWLVKHGADIEIQDSRGFTPYDLALPWLQKEIKEALYSRRDVPPVQVQQQQYQQPQQYQQAQPVSAAQPISHSYSQPAPMIMPTSSPSMLPPTQPMAAPHSSSPSAYATVRGSPTSSLADSYAQQTTYTNPLATVSRATVPQEMRQEVAKVFLRNQAYKSLVITSQSKAGDVCAMMAEKLGLQKYAYAFDLIDSVKGNERRVDPSANVFRIKKSWPTILGKTGNETEKHCKLIVAPKRGASEEISMLYRNAMYGK
mmetsp:Transcript_49822/g.125253  ORF Transcript_49822/g.125253 Transcript_49822/m.125253 type:complete len:546 (+) Transcript_49822:188-1825(+)